jgi:hypothetical protein
VQVSIEEGSRGNFPGRSDNRDDERSADGENESRDDERSGDERSDNRGDGDEQVVGGGGQDEGRGQRSV